MYPISNAVKALFESEQLQVLRITGTDRNGASISITDANIVANGFSIDRYSCNGEKLEIGTAISSEMTLKLDNENGAFDDIVFEGAELFVEIGIADWTQQNPTMTYIPCGYFTPDRQPRRLTTITLNALDRMTRFDATIISDTPWTTDTGDVVVDASNNDIIFASELVFPCTVANLISQVAALRFVPFTQNISAYPNASFVLAEMPDLQQTITMRTIIQWCAGIMGTNAWIDWEGKLRFSWYENSTGYATTTANRFSSDIYEDDITITGVSYTNTQNVTATSGTTVYALDMTGNFLAAEGIAQILPNINTALNGFTYRPFEAHVFNAPYLWPMDIITYTDKDSVNHTCILTNVNFGINGATAIAGRGETAQSNGYFSGSGVTTDQAFLIEKATEAATDAATEAAAAQLDEEMTQQEIFNRLTDGGQNQGLYLLNGKVYLDATYIQAGYLDVENRIRTNAIQVNKLTGIITGGINNNWELDFEEGTLTIGDVSADNIKSGTLTLGGHNNADGQLVVKDSNGDVIGTWTNEGITLNSGSIGDAEGNSSWNLDTGALNLNGTIVTTGRDLADNEYKTELENGILTFYFREDSEDPWTALVSMGIRNAFMAGLMPANQSGSVALNATLEDNGVIDGGSYVSADTGGDIQLRGSGLKVGPLDPEDPAYVLGGYDGYTGSLTVMTGASTTSTIEIVNGIIVDVT